MQHHGDTALLIQVGLSESGEQAFGAHFVRGEFAVFGGHLGQDVEGIAPVALFVEEFDARDLFGLLAVVLVVP